MRKRILAFVKKWNVQVDQQIAADLAEIAGGITGHLLDLGCGAKPYRKVFSKVSSYVGIDLPATISANHMEKRADVYGEIGRLPFCDACFDAVLSTQVLEHVPVPATVVLEAARVLRPGGTILLTIPFVAAEHEEPHDYFRFTRYGMQSLLEQNGFEAVAVKKQFGFWSMVGEMIYWHYQRKVQGSRWEKYWYAVGSTLFLRAFHLMNRMDPDEKLALNLFVTARRVARSASQKDCDEVPVLAVQGR